MAQRRTCWSPSRIAILGIFLFLVGLTIGVLSGYFGRRIPPMEPVDGVVLKGVSSKIISDADPRISDLLLEEIKANNIRQYLKDYASHPHLAGTSADKDQAEQLKQLWLDQGLDRVDIVSYDVLLSYPKKNDPSLIRLMNASGATIFQSQAAEEILRPEDINPGDEVVPPFNAYSPPGDVTSEKLIYVNYGREEDFYWLHNNRSVNFTDSVVISRYGKIFRADKVKFAHTYGAKAVILYSDPFDYASPTDNTSYPYSWWLPDTGVQGGTVKTVFGDPTTYLYPSLDSAYRDDPDSSPFLPKIPAHPISYGDAKNLLEQLGGDEVPDSWKGSIYGLTYRFGGSFTEAGMKVDVHITTRNQRNRTYNVIGYITGAVEPDRYVIVGNHRDGWVYGAVDPSSATAAMLEASRALGAVMKSADWRPRRTIVFCSWGAEEHGIVGSVEFAENFAKTIGQRAVAYLNADILIEGQDYMRFKATPMLFPAVIRAAKKIPNPNQTEVDAGRTTVFDTWVHVTPSDVDNSLPNIETVGSGSDYFYFLAVLGIPCLEPRQTWDKKKWKLSSYPMYHSVYETFYLMDSIMDPGFKYSRSVTQAWTELIRDISDSMILPLDVTSFSDFIAEESAKIIDAEGDRMRSNNLTLDIDYFNEAIAKLQSEAKDLKKRISNVNKMDVYVVREINDKLMNLHRSFLDPIGLPGREMTKNVLAAPSQFDSYAGAVFPTITDALYRIDTNTDPERWNKVRKAMSIVTYLIQSAASTLRKSAEFTNV